MANVGTAAVPVAIDLRDGGVHHLKYGVMALARVEDALGERSIFTIFRTVQWGVKLTSLMLWAGLLHEDPSLTHEMAAEMLDNYFQAGGQFDEVVQPIIEAVRQALIPRAEASGNGRGAKVTPVTADPQDSGSQSGTPESSRQSSGTTGSSPQPRND